jgi:branched-chain amino acid transport system permease protein
MIELGHTEAYFLQQALNALQLSAFYLPLSVAFAMIQAITRRIFLSFGDLAMFASFAAIYGSFDAMVSGSSDLTSGAAGLGLAILCGAALGFAVSRLMLSRELLRHPMAFMISSIGLAIFLQELMRLQSGNISIWIPPLLSDQYLMRLDGSFPVRIGLLTSLSIAVSAIAIAAVCLWLTWSRFGLAWRACAQHPLLAAMCGIDAQHVAAVSFAIAGGLSGITGWTSAIVYGGANFSVGLMAGFKAMFASVIGGFGTIRGAIVGAIVLAVAEVAWSAAFSTVYRDVAVFGFIVLVLVFRPEGLLGLASREKSFETQEP